MEGQLSAEVKEARLHKAMKLQKRIATELSIAQIGKTLRALVDQSKVARSHGDAPDIDGRILLSQSAPVGEFISVRITGAQTYDLVGQPVGAPAR
jgi:ribosomal protein S12 methylthiotransferase